VQGSELSVRHPNAGHVLPLQLLTLLTVASLCKILVIQVLLVMEI
jgi:hypothetical protein